MKPELELYAKRVRVLWDPKAYLWDPKALLEVLFPRILSQPCLRVFMTCDHKIIFPVIFDWFVISVRHIEMRFKIMANIVGWGDIAVLCCTE